MNNIRSHILLKSVLRAKKIIRHIQAVKKDNRMQILYLGNPPNKDHPLFFIWSLDHRYINSWILHGESMLYIWDELMVKLPVRILELGSGLSTIMFAKYAQWSVQSKCNSPEIVSIEHNEVWSKQVKMLLNQHNLQDYIQLIDCPIRNIEVDGFSGQSYDLSNIPIQKFDFVLIDGPPYYIGRVLTLPSVLSMLSNSVMIILDDAQRNPERDIIKEWKKKYKSKITFKGFVPVGTGFGNFEKNGNLKNQQIIV